MRLLLDVQLPHELRHIIEGHDVFTVTYAGLSGPKNGVLLRAAAERGVDALITNDHELEYQQHLSTLPIAIVVLQARANQVHAFPPILPALQRVLTALRPRTLVRVDVDG